MIKTRQSIFVVIAGLVWVAACSDSSAPDDAAGGTVTGGPVATAPLDPTTPTVADLTDVVHPPASGEFVGALDDVSTQTCEQEAAGWRVTGVAGNPTDSAVDYRIYISLLNAESVTRALVETELRAVAPHAEAMFDELITMPDQGLRCVIRVERRATGN